MSKNRKHGFKFLLGLLISAVLLFWTLKQVNLSSVFELLSQVNIFYLLLAVLLTSVSYILRAFRWLLFFKEPVLDLQSSFKALIVGFFMNNILPARMGELVRAHLGGKAANISRSKVLATIAGERLADGITVSLLFGGLFLFFSDGINSGSSKQIFYVSLVFLAIGFFTIVFLAFRKRVLSFLGRVAKIMPGHLSGYTLEKIESFIEGLEPMMEGPRVLKIFTWSFIIWSIELLVYYSVTYAFGQELSLAVCGLFLAIVNFSSLIPAAPGGIGVIEAAGTAALVSVGINKELAFGMVVLQHLIQILVVGVPGAYYFFRVLNGVIPDDEKLKLEEENALSDQNNVILSDFADLPQKQELYPKDLQFDLSIVIPAFNEELRISKTLSKTLEYLDKSSINAEILVVNDGSSDGTTKIIGDWTNRQKNIKLLSYSENQGKGYAVRFGVNKSCGRTVLFMDADGATPIEELGKLQAALEEGAHLAIGSRAIKAKDSKIKTSLHRKIMGRVFNGIVNVFVLPGIADTQCGFKLFYHNVAKDLFSSTDSSGFAFDVEILMLALKRGYKIVEVPVNWTNIAGSKVNIVVDSAKMALDIFKFKIKYFRA